MRASERLRKPTTISTTKKEAESTMAIHSLVVLLSLKTIVSWKVEVARVQR